VDNSDIARKVFWGILEFGPRDLLAVSQLIGVPYHKVYATFWRFYNDYKLTIWASPNLNALGLGTVYFDIKPTKEYRRTLYNAFFKVSNLNMLVIDANDYSTIVGSLYVPFPSRRSYVGFFEYLKSQGVIESYSSAFYETKHRYGLIVDYFDWEVGDYRFDWGSLIERTPETSPIQSSVSLADRIDVYILKELEADALQSFRNMSESLKRHNLVLSSRVLMYHYNSHIVPRKLLSRYRIFRNLKGILRIDYICEVREKNKELFYSSIRRIPYLDVEFLDSSHDLHVSNFYVPYHDYTNFTNYFLKHVSPYCEHVKGHMSLSGQRVSVTIPYELFKDKQGWVYNPLEQAQRVIDEARSLVSPRA
jgi:hypothetical protein